jgi:mono/diheme cytochrome c family protein
MTGSIRLVAGRAALVVLMCVVLAAMGRADETPPTSANPYLGKKEAQNEGEKIYRSRCFGCHFRAGGRGPNIFRSKLPEEQFFSIVKNGGGAGMPAWGATMSDDEIWKVHAFAMSRDRL